MKIFIYLILFYSITQTIFTQDWSDELFYSENEFYYELKYKIKNTNINYIEKLFFEYQVTNFVGNTIEITEIKPESNNTITYRYYFRLFFYYFRSKYEYRINDITNYLFCELNYFEQYPKIIPDLIYSYASYMQTNNLVIYKIYAKLDILQFDMLKAWVVKDEMNNFKKRFLCWIKKYE